MQSSWGGEFELIVPEGCGGGSTIEVELPVQSPDVPSAAVGGGAAEPDAIPAANAVDTAEAEEDPDDCYTFKKGQHVEVG